MARPHGIRRRQRNVVALRHSARTTSAASAAGAGGLRQDLAPSPTSSANSGGGASLCGSVGSAVVGIVAATGAAACEVGGDAGTGCGDHDGEQGSATAAAFSCGSSGGGRSRGGGGVAVLDGAAIGALLAAGATLGGSTAGMHIGVALAAPVVAPWHHCVAADAVRGTALLDACYNPLRLLLLLLLAKVARLAADLLAVVVCIPGAAPVDARGFRCLGGTTVRDCRRALAEIALGAGDGARYVGLDLAMGFGVSRTAPMRAHRRTKGARYAFRLLAVRLGERGAAPIG
eukprot:6788406-Prymnesium_polylepis.1